MGVFQRKGRCSMKVVGQMLPHLKAFSKAPSFPPWDTGLAVIQYL